MVDVRSAMEAILARRVVGSARSLLVALTGIDGCGKGFIARELAAVLRGAGLRAAVVNIDGWLNLPHVRFDAARPASHFYEHAIRFDEMFDEVVLPLKQRRSVRAVSRFVEETATAYRLQEWIFDDVDVILLEGIYLLKASFRQHYDLSIWIDCSFATALERALARQQERLSQSDTIAAYETIYFPAQRIHFERDAPRDAANLLVSNDTRLKPVAPADLRA